MRPSFPQKCKPTITRISALPNKQGSQPKKTCLLTKKSATILVCLVGQKSGKILVDILGETMVSYIHSEFDRLLPIIQVYGQKTHFKMCSNTQQVDLKNFLPFLKVHSWTFFLTFSLYTIHTYIRRFQIFQTSRYQGIAKATVSGEFEDLNFKGYR